MVYPHTKIFGVGINRITRKVKKRILCEVELRTFNYCKKISKSVTFQCFIRLFIRKTVTKNQSEFIALYDRHGNALYRFVLFKVNNREIAWDLTQESLLKMWKYINDGQVKKIANHKALLFTIARNLVIDYWRAKARTETIGLDMETMDVADDDADAHALILLKDEARATMKLIEKLPEDDRELLTLRYTEELSFNEISKITGKNAIAARVKIHRALKKLKKIITP